MNNYLGFLMNYIKKFFQLVTSLKSGIHQAILLVQQLAKSFRRPQEIAGQDYVGLLKTNPGEIPLVEDDAVPIPRGRVTIKLTFYVKSRHDTESRRKTTRQNPSTASTMFPKAVASLNVDRRNIAQLPKMCYLDTDEIEHLIDIIYAEGDDTIHSVLDNLMSGLQAIEWEEEGDATEVHVREDHDLTVPLRDNTLKSIKFKYVKNSPLFEPIVPSTGDLTIKRNSCLMNLIIKTFASALKNKIELTHENLWKICKPDAPMPEDDEYPLSLQEAKTFFELFRFKLVAVDIYCRLVMYYDPVAYLPQETQRSARKKTNYTLRILVHHKHAYEINHNIASFNQVVKKLAENCAIHASPHYYIFDEDNEKQKSENVFLQKQEEIQAFIQSYKGESQYVKVLTDYPIDTLLLDFLDTHGIVGASLKMHRGRVKSFQVEQNEVVFDLVNATLTEAQANLWFKDKVAYENYMNKYNNMYRLIINNLHKSHYHPQFAHVMTQLQRGPLSGMFINDPNYSLKEGPNMDLIKAYAAQLLRMEKFPVADEWCIFKPYVKGSPIEEYNLYIVHKANIENTEELILFNKKCNLMSGFTVNLAMESNIAMDIQWEWKPIKFIQNTLYDHVKKLFDDPTLTEDEKKMIVNICIGCLDKQYNEKNRAEFFQDRADAWAKQRAIPNSKFLSLRVKQIVKTIISELDFGLPGVTYQGLEEDHNDKTNLYAVVTTDRQLLQDGFKPTSIIKYDLHRAEMFKMYKVLKQEGFTIMGMNTDSLFVAHDQRQKLKDFEEKYKGTYFPKENDTLFSRIGLWKRDDKRCRKKLIQQEENFVNIEDPWTQPLVVLHADDEENYKKNKRYERIAMKLMKTHDLRIGAPSPGSGKSELMKLFAKSKKHLLVIPFNNQKEIVGEETGLTTITTSRLLGLDEKGEPTHKPYDVEKEGIEVILLDEIYVLTRRILYKLYRFKLVHPKIRYHSTGDPYQVDVIEKCLLRTNEECIDIMFPMELELLVIKRVSSEEDKEGYRSIKHCLFEEKLPHIEVVEKHKQLFGPPIHSLEELKTVTNLCYEKCTKDLVNDQVFHSIKGQTIVRKGQEMKCKGYVSDAKRIEKNGKSTKTALIRNRVYVVARITSKGVDLKEKDDKTNTIFRIDRGTFDSVFEKPYCDTVHSSIGLTIREPVTIFNLDFYHSNAKWLYTAITRTTKLSHIRFYMGPPLLTTKEKYEHNLRKRIRKKIAGHKTFDIKNGIFDEKNFIDEEWGIQKLKDSQGICGHRQCLLSDRPGDDEWSFDRLENDIGHTKDNCRVTCVSCNKGKH